MTFFLFMALSFPHKDCEECRLLKEGWEYQNKKQYDSAISLYLKAIVAAQEFGNQEYEAYALINTGNCLSKQNKLEEANHYHLKARKLFADLKNTEQHYYCLRNIAHNYNNMGSHLQSIEYYSQAEGLIDQLKPYLKCDFYISRARTYYELQNFQLARKDFQLAREIAEVENLQKQQITVNIGLANLEMDESNLHKAKKLLVHAKDNAAFLEDSILLGMITNNLGEIALRENHNGDAEQYLIQSLEIKKKVNPGKLPTTQFRLGEFYTINGEYALAKQMLDVALQAGEKAEDLQILFGTYDALSKYYQAIEDFPRALDALRTIDSLKTERFNKQRLAVERFQADQDRDQAFAELDTQIQLNKTQRKINHITIGGILLLSIAFIVFFFQFRSNLKLRRKVELLLKEQNHRVKNNLQMIGSLLSLQSKKLESKNIKDVLISSQSRINSVALLNRMLYEGRELGLISVTEYLTTLIEEIKFTSPRESSIELNASGDYLIVPEKATSLGLIANELITNSIKHVNPVKSLEVIINLEIKNRQMTIKYQDNGEDFDKESWGNSSSFGNELVKLQVEQMRGRYEFQDNAGFSMVLSLPV